MAAIEHSPTLRRRRLSAELRRLREASGLTAEEVSRRLEWSRGKLTHIERAQWRRPSPRDVRDLLDVYGVTDEARRDALIALARDARRRNLWSQYKDVLTGMYVDLEVEATSIRTYEPLVVPGLLQTADYTAALLHGAGVDDPREVERRVEVRGLRQEILHREHPPVLSALIDEAALRKPVGGAVVMRAQMERLAELSRSPNVTVRMVPDEAGAHPGMQGQYVILDFEDDLDPSVVYLETATDGLYLEQPQDVARYSLIHDRLRDVALSTEVSGAWFRARAGRPE